MRKLVTITLLSLSGLILAQDTDNVDPIDTIPVSAPLPRGFIMMGDTVLNLNSLNNGIQKFQLSDESKSKITANGMEIKEGGVIVLVDNSKLVKDFYFDVKTFASDKEWYENHIKIKVSQRSIYLINVTSDKIEMATGFRKDGKIYVVILVSIILFGVICSYLITLERRSKKLAKRLDELEK